MPLQTNILFPFCCHILNTPQNLCRRGLSEGSLGRRGEVKLKVIHVPFFREVPRKSTKARRDQSYPRLPWRSCSSAPPVLDRVSVVATPHRILGGFSNNYRRACFSGMSAIALLFVLPPAWSPTDYLLLPPTLSVPLLPAHKVVIDAEAFHRARQRCASSTRGGKSGAATSPIGRRDLDRDLLDQDFFSPRER